MPFSSGSSSPRRTAAMGRQGTLHMHITHAFLLQPSSPVPL